jgi:hypothetical protein
MGGYQVSRIRINFPWIFASLSGVQPASELDDNNTAVDSGTITIGARVLAASYAQVADDDFSFFLCVPTNNMNLTLPPSPNPSTSFWVSNQNTVKTVTLIGSLTIDGVPVTNPGLPGNFGSLVNVIGGFCVFDGSTWSLFPKLFML